MKRIIYILIFGFILSSCDDFLTEEPVHKQTLENAVVEDDAAMKAAASSGDQEAYHKAISSKSFHEAQLEQLRSTVILPALSKEEIEAMTKEIQDQRQREEYNAYAKILKLRNECRPVLEQYRKSTHTFTRLDRLLQDAGNLRLGPLGLAAVWPPLDEVVSHSRVDRELEEAIARAEKKFNTPQP